MTVRRVPLALGLLLLSTTPTSAVKPTCADRLGGRVFRCEVKSSFGSAFEDCYRFTVPGTRSAQLDLVADGVAGRFGCACQPAGSFQKPKFDTSAAFTCTGGGTGGLFSLILSGKAAGKDDKLKIRSGTGVNDAGEAFRFECELDAACELPGDE